MLYLYITLYSTPKKNWGTIAFTILQIIGFAMLEIFVFEKLFWQIWYSFTILGATLAVLVANLLTPMLAMKLAVTALLAAKDITPQEAFAGLFCEGILGVAIFFIVAEAVCQTTVLRPIFWCVPGRPKTSVEARIGLIVLTNLVSSFLSFFLQYPVGRHSHPSRTNMVTPFRLPYISAAHTVD